jgi:hypothetical protein
MTLANLIEDVQRKHAQRLLECRQIPKQRRGRREKLRPNTALISHAVDKLFLNVEHRTREVILAL